MNQNSQNSNLEVDLHSQEVHEILSYIPHWIIRWGIGLVLVTVVLILMGSWFIRYPEVIPAQITITSQNPPKPVVVRSTGNINLLVENGSWVNRGQPLGYIETSADYEDVSILQSYIKGLSLSGDSLKNKQERIENLSSLNLGQMQGTFETFSQRSQSLSAFKEIDYYQKQIAQLVKRIDNYQLLNSRLLSQQEIYEEEYKISVKKMKMDSTLYSRQAISEIQFDNARLSLLQDRREKENAETTILNNQLQINQLEGQISELRLQFQQENQQLARSISESLELLKSNIATWEDQYVLKAPVKGTVTFFEIWSDNQYVEQGEEVMNVVPKEKELFGLLRMSIAQSGKVAEGQKVNIKLSNYPYQEYGILKGKVEEISLVPKQDAYLIYVSLPEGLKTSYDNTLEFKQKMQGSAEVVTEDLRLLERIFYQLREVFGRI